MSVNDAINHILNAPAPILMFDTCGLLDVMRFPRTGFISHNSIVNASRLIQDPRGIHIVVTETVLKEYKKLIDDEQKQTKNALALIDRQHNSLYQAMQHLPDAAVNPYPGSQPVLIGADDVANRIRMLIEGLLSKAICLILDKSILDSVTLRQAQNKLPARNGKGHPDCAIIESYFALMEGVRNNDISEKAWFISSNKSDFCSDGYKIHEDLAGNFNMLQLDFLSELSRLPLDAI
ncbi:MAG: PIN domain-containing protein [Gammaproteobacteria bacterium]